MSLLCSLSPFSPLFDTCQSSLSILTAAQLSDVSSVFPFPFSPLFNICQFSLSIRTAAQLSDVSSVFPFSFSPLFDICQVFIHPYGRHSSQMSPRIVTLGLRTLYIPLPLSAHRACEWDGILLPLLGHTTWGLLRKLSSKGNLPAIQEPLKTRV